jgi:hypothetical protein
VSADKRPRSEKRQRNKLVLVRLNDAEWATLAGASTRTGKPKSRLLREAFLTQEAHR